VFVEGDSLFITTTGSFVLFSQHLSFTSRPLPWLSPFATGFDFVK
jgi:hypothetical protein